MRPLRVDVVVPSGLPSKIRLRGGRGVPPELSHRGAVVLTGDCRRSGRAVRVGVEHAVANPLLGRSVSAPAEIVAGQRWRQFQRFQRRPFGGARGLGAALECCWRI